MRKPEGRLQRVFNAFTNLHLTDRPAWIIKQPIVTFLVLVYVMTTALVFVPKALTGPGLLPGGATPHGILENVLGSAVPAFIVTALVSGKAGVWELARRSFRLYLMSDDHRTSVSVSRVDPR